MNTSHLNIKPMLLISIKHIKYYKLIKNVIKEYTRVLQVYIIYTNINDTLTDTITITRTVI